MTTKEPMYKLSLSGGDITVKDRHISEGIARKIITIIMGGSQGAAGEDPPHRDQHPHLEHESGSAQGSAPSPKIFMAQKKPSSELERIICLAFYLQRYRNTQVFKTRDLTKLNIDAAQRPFSNPAVFARNAASAGWFSKAGGGSKQLTVLGEAIVTALPDRDAVKKAIEEHRTPRMRRSKKRSKKSSE